MLRDHLNRLRAVSRLTAVDSKSFHRSAERNNFAAFGMVNFVGSRPARSLLHGSGMEIVAPEQERTLPNKFEVQRPTTTVCGRYGEYEGFPPCPHLRHHKKL